MKKILFVFIALLATGISFAQSAIVNDYKYIIIPKKFDFLKTENQFNINSLTKATLEKYGFTVFYTNDKFPDELALDRCKALYADVISDSGMLTTKLKIVFKDCNGKEVYATDAGKSREKDYQKAYYEALREAFAYIGALNYKYSGGPATAAVAAAPAEKAAVQASEKHESVPATAAAVHNENTLFAQPLANGNGYQLVDSTPKVVLKIYKTTMADSYTAQGEGKSGVVFKKDNQWFFEYYQNDKLISEKLTIKF
jgi:hypothetical protein